MQDALVRLETEQSAIASRYCNLMSVRDKAITEMRTLKSTNDSIEQQLCLLHSNFVLLTRALEQRAGTGEGPL